MTRGTRGVYPAPPMSDAPKPQALRCPSCNGRMVSRQNRQSGQRFWGCADFPRCKGTRNTDGDSPSEARQRRQNEIGDYDYDSADDFHPGHPSNYGDN